MNAVYFGGVAVVMPEVVAQRLVRLLLVKQARG